MFESQKFKLRDYGLKESIDKAQEFSSVLKVSTEAQRKFHGFASQFSDYDVFNDALSAETENYDNELFTQINKLAENARGDIELAKFARAGALQAHKLLRLQQAIYDEEIGGLEMPKLTDSYTADVLLYQVKVIEKTKHITYFVTRGNSLNRENPVLINAVCGALKMFGQNNHSRLSSVQLGAIFVHDLLVEQSFLDVEDEIR